MRILFFCTALLLCSCHTAPYNKDSSLKPSYLDEPSGTIHLNKKLVNGLCYPDYMQEEEVHKYAEMFKRDEGDSVHYRLGRIGDMRCVSTDSVTCDTLRLFVLKLVPFSPPKKMMTELTSNVWQVERTMEYDLVNQKMISIKDSIDDDGMYFGCVYGARSKF